MKFCFLINKYLIFKNLILYLFFISFVQSSENPVIVYMSNVYQLIIENHLLSVNLPSKNFEINKEKISENSVKLLMDFIFYENVNKSVNLSQLWPDATEINNKYLSKDPKIVNEFLNKSSIKKMYIDMKNNLLLFQNTENTLDSLMGNYYFSIYNQKFLIIQFLSMFCKNSESADLHNILYTIQLHYPENPDIPWLMIMMAVNYYESISPFLYQSNFDCIFHGLSLLHQLKENYPEKIKKYDNFIKILEINFKFIQCEKEIHKALTLINNGQTIVGYNLLRIQLKKYKYLLNNPLRIYDIYDYIEISKPSTTIKTWSLAIPYNTNNIAYDTVNYYNILNKYYFKNHLLMESRKDLDNIISKQKILIIKNSSNYKKYLQYKNIFKQLKRKIM